MLLKKFNDNDGTMNNVENNRKWAINEQEDIIDHHLTSKI